VLKGSSMSTQVAKINRNEQLLGVGYDDRKSVVYMYKFRVQARKEIV